MYCFKKKKHLAILLVFMILILNIPVSKVEAASKTFDFESGMSGSTVVGDEPRSNKIVTQNLSGHTLAITQDEGNILYMLATDYNGDFRSSLFGTAVIMDASYDTSTKLTLTVSGGYTFDLNSINAMNQDGGDISLKFTTSKGYAVKTLYENGGNGSTIDLSAETFLKGISSVEITRNAGGTILLELDDVILDNITSPMVSLEQVNGASLSSTGIASWNDVPNESSYDVQLYKNGVAEGSVVNVAENTSSYDFLSLMRSAGEGTYTVKVTAKGDNITFSDGAESAASGSQTITKIATVTAGMTWSGDIAYWTGVANAASYDVQLYKDGNVIGSAVNVLSANIASGIDFSSEIATNGGGTYTYKIVPKSNSATLYIDGNQSAASNDNNIVTQLSKVTGVFLSVSGVANWNDVSNESSYDIQLYKNGLAEASVVNRAANTSSYDFLSAMRSAGEGTYTVKVTAKGNGATTSDGPSSDESNVRSIIQLSDVTAGLTWTGNIAHWIGVANATSYDVQLYKDGNAVGSIINVLSANISSGADFSSAIATNGGGTYTYKVTTKGDSIFLLNSSISVSSNNNVVATPLSQVTGVSLSASGVSSWNDVSSESSYDLQLYKNGVAEGSVVNVAENTSSYDFLSAMRSAGEGTYTVKVTAKGDNITFSDGAQSAASGSQTITKISTVTAGMTWSGDIAYWTGVANAASYDVQLYKDGNELGSPVNVLSTNIASGADFSSEIATNGGGTYTYKITAKGNDVLLLDASISVSSNDNIVILPLSKVTGVSLSELGVANWNDVSNESSYDVQLYKNGLAEGSVVNRAENTSSYDFLSLMRSAGEGTYTVKVTAKGNGATTNDGPSSDESNSRDIIQLSDVTAGLAWTGNIAHWIGVANATSYDVQLYKDGNAVGSIINVLSANISSGVDFSSAIATNGGGTYTYKVTAKGNQILLLDAVSSANSQALVITPPDTTLPVFGGGGVLSTSDLTSNSVKLSWIPGTDNQTLESNLEYKVVKSTSNNINTVVLAEQNGNIIQDWAKNINFVQATGLTPNTTYYFIVIIKDEEGNKNVYNITSNKTLTDNPPIIQNTIIFEANGGTAVPAQIVNNGSKASRPNNPTKSGYNFVDWYQESSLTNVFDFNTIIGNDTTLYAKWSTSTSSGGNNSSGSKEQEQKPNTNPTANQNTDIIINGDKFNIGNEVIIKNDAGNSEANVTVQKESILKQIDSIENQGSNNVQINVGTKDADKVVIGLTGDIIKSLENRNFDLSIKKDDVSYQIPAKEFTIDKIADVLGVANSQLEKIDISVTVQKTSKEILETIKSQSENVDFIVNPVQFELKAIVADSTGKTKEVIIDKFGQYIERTLEIPKGIDPSKITTGIVFNNDLTFEHVPTVVTKDGDKWIARINSRTNSTYSVVYNPITVNSVEKHWSKLYVNDMASRMIISEISNFNPDEAITRAEFADYIVRGLGLFRKNNIRISEFKDVSESNNFKTSIMIAKEYGIISGYSDGKFKPSDKITREEAMIMFVNAMNLTELKVTELKELNQFTDVGKVSKWANEGVQKSISSKIFNGRSKDKIEPQGVFTKAEAATAIRNLLIEAELINN